MNTLPARRRESNYLALAAVVLGGIALVLGLVSLPGAGRQQAPAPSQPSAGPATIDFSLIITGIGAPGEARHHFFEPSMIVVRRGDRLQIRVMNLAFSAHGVQFDGYGVQSGMLSGGPTAQETLSFVADRAGIFRYHCNIPYDPARAMCSPDHETQVGYLVVLDEPR